MFSIPLDQVAPWPLGLADDRVLTLSEFAKLAWNFTGHVASQDCCGRGTDRHQTFGTPPRHSRATCTGMAGRACLYQSVGGVSDAGHGETPRP